MLNSLPIFGICGYSGSGKTTLLERLVPRLVLRGLRVAVVKHDVHGIEPLDPDKDSERLLRAGADAVLCGPGESLSRGRLGENTLLEAEIERLVDRYDLVLLEGFKSRVGQKAWLMGPDGVPPPDQFGPYSPVLPWDADRVSPLESFLARFVEERMLHTAAFGCVLIGGSSRRMGSPKHLLASGDAAGDTWLHRTVRVLEACCQRVVLAGCGTIPNDLAHLPRLPDALEVQGPTAGLLSAMRWAPRASWLLAACDMPLLSAQAVSWVLSQRKPGVWAVLPRISERHPVEPLLAWYDFRCRESIESFAALGTPLRRIADQSKCQVALIPAAIAGNWQDVDTPGEASLLAAQNKYLVPPGDLGFQVWRRILRGCHPFGPFSRLLGRQRQGTHLDSQKSKRP